MPTPDATEPPSLMPYLNSCFPGIGLRLDSVEAPSEHEAATSADSDAAFTTMRNGRIIIDGHNVLTDFMMLSQADTYAFGTSELAPVTNLDVERSWQQAWDRMQETPGETRAPDAPVILPAQLDSKGGLKAVRPLFYCRQKGRYAHLLCPFCGGALTLCCDDDLLEAAGLAVYSSSLERYLFCPVCHQDAAEAPFYRYSVPAAAPARAQGGNDLLVAYSRLLSRSDLALDLPCIGCDEAAACYGAETAVLNRMIPVQFYPFHMFLLKAPTLNALDFLPLLGGAPVDTVQVSAVRSHKQLRSQLLNRFSMQFAGAPGLLFARETQRFLEVLYLKLSFLHELWALILDGAKGPVNRMSMEGIGVVLADQGARLPFLWNFSLKLIDPIGRPTAAGADNGGSKRLAGEFLGLAWHYVLLVNAAQPMTVVQAALESLRLAGVDQSSPTTVPETPVFAPGNLFWEASDLNLAPDAKELWQQTLDLGRQLLQPGFLESQSRTVQEFERRLVELKQRVHQSLFQASAGTGADRKTCADADDARIAEIIETILKKWPSEAAPGKDSLRTDETQQVVASSGQQPNEDGDFEETVILSTTSAEIEESAAAVDPALEKTVVMSPSPGRKIEAALERTMAASGPPSPPEDPRMAETVVIQAPAASSPSADLEKTVVLSTSGNPDDGEALEKTIALGSAPQAPTEDDLEETILQPHARTKAPASVPGSTPANAPATHTTPPEDADDLEATVVLRPKTGKDRIPKP
jgi:hypothetical protein